MNGLWKINLIIAEVNGHQGFPIKIQRIPLDWFSMTMICKNNCYHSQALQPLNCWCIFPLLECNHTTVKWNNAVVRMIPRKTRKHPRDWLKSKQINFLIIKPGRLNIMQKTKHHKPTTFTQVCALHLTPKITSCQNNIATNYVYFISITQTEMWFNYAKLTWYTNTTRYSKKACIIVIYKNIGILYAICKAIKHTKLHDMANNQVNDIYIHT